MVSFENQVMTKAKNEIFNDGMVRFSCIPLCLAYLLQQRLLFSCQCTLFVQVLISSMKKQGQKYFFEQVKKRLTAPLYDAKLWLQLEFLIT